MRTLWLSVTTAGGRCGVALAVTVTGARAVEHLTAEELVEVFEAYVLPFAVPGAHFYLGGAVGVDTAALDWLAEVSKADVSVVVPRTVRDQPDEAADVIVKWREAGRLAELVELDTDEVGTDGYLERNRWMVDRSELVIGFPRSGDQGSGTGYTLGYAASKGKALLVVPI
ncbi:hypothetical protein [Umezawaea tangerina]|uniref:hypothetical protein n=1 Tax=Umezawaea tangerina TaxID=84725 RepID=UPI001FE8EEF4|nr:hypothetical protein [Umezawaea tangerina]